MTRLFVDSWWGRPDLVRAFLSGYGRALRRNEQTWLRLSAGPTLARDLRHVLARGRQDAIVTAKLDRFGALYDGRSPALPRPFPGPLRPLARALGAVGVVPSPPDGSP